MRNNTKKGFTLVELLVVIAILAILATVSVVGYTSFIEGAAVRVDGDMVTQLNHFLAAYKVNNTGDINEDNIWQVTQEVLELSGVEELNPQAAQYGYHFYYDFETEQYVSLHNREALDEDSPLFNFLMAFAEGEEETPSYKPTPGNCFTKGGQYFLVDTTGTNIATAVSGFYSFGLTEEATLEETAAKFEEFCAVIDALPTDAFDSWLNETVFATVNGNFVVDVKGTHKNLIVHREATYITHIKQDVAGLVDDFRANGGYLLTVTEPTTITVPAGVGVIEGSLWIDGDATIVLAGNSWNMIDCGFTNRPVNVGGSTYTLDTTDSTKVLDASGNVVATLKANYIATGFDFALALDNGKAIHNPLDGAGYVALDNLGFTAQLTNFTNDSGKSFIGASRSDVEWGIKYIKTNNNRVDEVVDGIGTYVVKGEGDSFNQQFDIITAGEYLPALDTVVVTAKLGTTVKEYTVNVVRITGISGKIGGDTISLTDTVANLVCNTDANGKTVATNFDFVPAFEYNHTVEGLGIDLSNGINLTFTTTTSHTHSTAECCIHKHDTSKCTELKCSHDCTKDKNCSYVACDHVLHSVNNYECCTHDCEKDGCPKQVNCTHDGMWVEHIKADGTRCEAKCSSHEHTDYSVYKYCYHYIYTEVVPNPSIATHNDECCKYETIDTTCSNNYKCCKLCLESGSKPTSTLHKQHTGDHVCAITTEHTHNKYCCRHAQSAAKYHDGTQGSGCCAHCHGYHPDSEYDETCTHATDGHNKYCYTYECSHIHTPTSCDKCGHNHDGEYTCSYVPCDFRCTNEDDCLTCDHSEEDCQTECYPSCGVKAADINGDKGVIGHGTANGKLTIKVGVENAYYTSLTVDLKFYGGFDTVANDNITHLGNVNIIKVEDLFGGNIPSGAVIAIFDDTVNTAEEEFISVSRYLLADKTEGEKDGLAFYVEDNIIERKADGTWEEIKFYGEGDVYIAVISGGYNVDSNGLLSGERISKDIVAEVVAAKNVRDYADFDTKGSNVLLADVELSGGTIKFEGGTIYGNHYTFDITKGATTGTNGIITLSNTNMQDLRVIGALYPQVGISGLDPYGANAVLALGNVTIENCYIANTRAPLASGYEDGAAHDITLNNTILFGGRYANIDMRGGTLTFEGTVMTINQPHTDFTGDVSLVDLNERFFGFGVTLWVEVPTTAKIINANNLVQYNFISEKYNNIEDLTIHFKDEQKGIDVTETFAITPMFNSVFSNPTYSSYHFERDGDKYINAAIIGEDLGTFATSAIINKLNLPYGDRTGFNIAPNGYQYVPFPVGIHDSAYTGYLHLYGLMNDPAITDEVQDKMFEDSKDAEFIYSPWDHILNGAECPAYDFGSDNEIIPADLLK